MKSKKTSNKYPVSKLGVIFINWRASPVLAILLSVSLVFIGAFPTSSEVEAAVGEANDINSRNFLDYYDSINGIDGESSDNEFKASETDENGDDKDLTDEDKEGHQNDQEEPLEEIVEKDREGAGSLEELKEMYQIDELSELDDQVSVVITIDSESESDIAVSGDDLLEQAKQQGFDITVNHSYDVIFSGYSIEVDTKNLEEVFQLPGVKEVFPVGTVETTGHTVYPQMGVEESWDLQSFSSLQGEGVNVAVLDTGVDFNHPDLGDGFGLGNKVVDGYDYVNGRSEPLDDEGHGTHVAGVIAGNGDFQGVAPEANILAYKVLDERGEGSTDDILAALDDIISDRRQNNSNAADVINMSFGSRQDYVGSLIANALESAVEEGISVVMAGGNEGPGQGSLDFPDYFSEHNDSIITVGASGADAMEVNISVSGISGFLDGELLLYSPAPDLDGPTQVESVEGGSSYNDFTDQSGESLVDGKIAILQRGDGTYREMAENAERAGAEALLVYNNDTGMFYGSLVEPANYIPTISLSRQAGRQIEERLEQGNVWASLNNDSRIADFSSRGPSSEYTVKPDLVAPGKNVMSTWIYRDYSWSEGTSVSAAFVSGTIALLQQDNPDWSPARIKSALMNSAEPLTNSVGRTYSPTTQGSGELRTYDALTLDTIVKPGTLTFDPIDYFGYQFQDDENIEIYNDSNSNRRYRARVDFHNSHQDLVLEPEESSFTVSAGSSKDLDIDLIAYTNTLPAGEYEGYLEIEDVTGGETHQIPFLIVMEEEETDHDVDLGVSPFVVSDYQGSDIDVNVSDPVDRLEISLYDENRNLVDTLHNRTTPLGPGEHSFSWDGEDGHGNPVEDGRYYLDVRALPRGEEPYPEDNWMSRSRETAVDRSPPEIQLAGDEFQDVFASSGESTVHVDTASYTLEGNINDLSLDIDSRGVDLTIAGERVSVDEDGSFQHDLDLGEDVEEVMVVAEDWAGNSTSVELDLVYEREGVALKLHERTLNLDHPPVVENGRVLVPIDNVVASLMGGSVDYLADEQEDTDYVEVSRAGNTLELYHGETTAYQDEESIELNISPRIVQDSMLVPIREIAEPLGIDVEWDEQEQVVHLEDAATETSYRHHISGGRTNISDVDIPMNVISGRRFMLGRFFQDTFGMDINPAQNGLYFTPTVDTFMELRDSLVDEVE